MIVNVHLTSLQELKCLQQFCMGSEEFPKNYFPQITTSLYVLCLERGKERKELERHGDKKQI